MLEFLRTFTFQTAFLVAAALVSWRFRGFERARFHVLEHVSQKWWRGPLYCVLLVIAARLALLPFDGIHPPVFHDEFSLLLMGDTFAHGRVTNPVPPSWEHFETFHVNLVPTYQSKYPVAQGLVLAFGQVVFGNPWCGVLLSTALMAAAVVWALQAFVPRKWAFLGGVLCALHLGVVGYWVNSYWGGSVPALGGALALGGSARLLQKDRAHSQTFNAVLFGIGLGMLATSRPFEGLFFSVPMLLSLLGTMVASREKRGALLRAAAETTAVLAIFTACALYYNYRNTGNALVLPYQIYEHRYSTTPLVMWGNAPPIPKYHHPVMAGFYAIWVYPYYAYTRSMWGVLDSEHVRFVQWWEFYLKWSLTIPVAIGVWAAIRDKKYWLLLWCGCAGSVALSLALFFQPHYFAPASVILYGLAVLGMYKLWSGGSRALRAIAGALCVLTLTVGLAEAMGARYADPTQGTARELVASSLEAIPGKHLVLVSYGAGHVFDYELVYNSSDIAGQRIIWARKMSPAKDAELCQAFPGRKIWDVVTNDKQVSLLPSTLCSH